ncbi:hypothetical protein [Paenibacillus sp. SYP-B4298]|uniref:hypothetical protein n=1 Tax=Paenibacillus sp. SYP-B4298 TaxID=2996034 RepID=UPI0022DCF2AE|nr:hypothetical protein [Paenibacillus sp. SYP-B4298]
MRLLWRIPAFICLLIILGCNNPPTEQPVTTNNNSNVTEQAQTEITETPDDQNPPNEFAFKIGDQQIALHDWDDQADLTRILGTPLSESVEEMKFDTHTGSLLKKLTYDGLELELFSPKGNKQSFWIMTMIASKSGFATPDGIEVGDSVQKLQEVYSDLRVNDEDPNQANYERSNPDQFNTMTFEMQDGKVTTIKIYHSIP